MVNGETAVGVPLISPVVALNVRPAGKAGEIDQDATGPPLAVGAIGVMAVPFSAVNELGENVMPEGAATSTSMVMVAVAFPPVLLAVTV